MPSFSSPLSPFSFDEITLSFNAGSIYHLTKCLDALCFQFYNKNDGLRVTDLHQGIVWGTNTIQVQRSLLFPYSLLITPQSSPLALHSSLLSTLYSLLTSLYSLISFLSTVLSPLSSLLSPIYFLYPPSSLLLPFSPLLYLCHLHL